jgi:hypothetical protein
MLAVDRQLKAVDVRQREFFANFLDRNVGTTPLVVLPDPVLAFGRPSPTGTETVHALRLTLSARPHLVLSGDIHHYRRDVDGPTTHVTAGGGGAFLHPAQIADRHERQAAVEWPGPEQSRALLLQVPWRIAFGKAGVLPHLAGLFMFAPILVRSAGTPPGFIGPAILLICSTILLAAMGGVRRRRSVLVPAILAGLVLAAGAFALGTGVVELSGTGVARVMSHYAPEIVLAVVSVCLALGVAAFAGAFVFGAYLSALTWLGHENTQAFTALDHPGFKHFVRLRVRADGSAVDAWCVGLVDPLREDEQPLLVDSFTWTCR